MAERRMFAKSIIDSDAFLDMPMSARLLYYDLGMRADDDGFINSPKKIMRTIGATTDDMNILIARKFVIPFDTGVVVIKAWRINNYLRNDRYKKTNYQEEFSSLSVDEIGMYHSENEVGIPSGIPMVDTGKDSIGKDSIGNNNIYGAKSKRFVPPTLDEVKNYCLERNNNVDAQRFIDFYEAKGWYVGKNKMKDWKAAVRTWESNRKDNQNIKQEEVKDATDYTRYYEVLEQNKGQSLERIRQYCEQVGIPMPPM